MCTKSNPILEYGVLPDNIRCDSSTPSNKIDQVDQDTIAEKKQSRKVRFQEGPDNKIQVEIMGSPFTPASEMPDTEKEQIWWDHKDLEFFKHSALYVAQEVQRRQIDDKNPYSYTCVLMRIHGACCRIKPINNKFREEKDLKVLEQWAKLGHCRRGLERWSIPSIGSERLKRKYVTVHSVLALQKLLNAKTDIDNDIKIDIIRRTSEEMSRPARKFARVMGQADAIVSCDPSCSDPEKIFSEYMPTKTKLQFHSGCNALVLNKPEIHHLVD